MMAAVLAASSCSDFDDYNEVPGERLPSASQSLWENISGNAELSQFAALVKKSGYDKLLSSSRFYTVWAPLNGKFDHAKWEAADSATVRFQFVENHITDYNHYISAPVDERITTLNEKTYDFKGTSADAKFGGVAVEKANVAGRNGVMHLLDGEAIYRPNFYEYLTANKAADSLSAYILRYEQSVLDEENSVAGPIVNGVQTYEDSVMIVSNTMLRRFDAKLDSEDSTYTVFVPTNEAWNTAYAAIKSTLSYGKGVIKSEKVYMQNGVLKTEDVKQEVNAAYLSDSLTCLTLASGLYYSNNNQYNKWLVDGNSFADTLYSTTRTKYSHPQEILARQVGETEQMSNGELRVVDSLAFRSWEWYNPVLQSSYRMSAYKNASVPQYITARTLREGLEEIDIPHVDMANFLEDGLRFSWIQPKTMSDMIAYFNLQGGVLSTKYSIYCVIVPPCADANYAAYDPDAEMKPSLFNASLSYYDPAKGETKDHFFHPTNPEGDSKGPKTTAAKLGEWAFKNSLDKVDPIYLGDFTFPVSYTGLESCYPYVKITFPRLDYKSKETYVRDLRVAGIILVPVELSKSNEQ